MQHGGVGAAREQAARARAHVREACERAAVRGKALHDTAVTHLGRGRGGGGAEELASDLGCRLRLGCGQAVAELIGGPGCWCADGGWSRSERENA